MRQDTLGSLLLMGSQPKRHQTTAQLASDDAILLVWAQDVLLSGNEAHRSRRIPMQQCGYALLSSRATTTVCPHLIAATNWPLQCRVT